MIGRKLKIVGSVAIILILSVVLMGVFSNMKEEPPRNEKKVAKVYVKAEKVVYSDMSPIFTEGGRLGSQNKVDVMSEVQGKILATNTSLKKGERFKKGDLLIRIFDEEARNNLMASKSRFLNMFAGILPDLNIDYPENYSKWLQFYESIDIAESLPELVAFSSNKEKTFFASRNILNDYYLIKSAEIRLSKYSIYAPFSGSFTDVYFEVGSIANPGGRIATIIQTDKLELEIPVKVENIEFVKIGEKVKIEANQHELAGKVVRISDFVSPETQSVSVFISLYASPKIKLFEGMYLNASFSGKPLSKVMEMPRNAVVNRNKVFVVEAGRLAKKEIKVLKVNETTLLFSGLDENSILVVEPLINPRVGMNVEILK
jgi:membrane fusion protein, multidrug efflux system